MASSALVRGRADLAGHSLAGFAAFGEGLGLGLVAGASAGLPLLEQLLELVDTGLQGLDLLVGQLPRRLDRRADVAAVALDPLEHLALDAVDVTDRDVVELAGGAGPDDDGLLGHPVRRVL